MTGPKAASIPSWQQAAQKDPPSDISTTPEQSSPAEPESDEPLVEQAKRFLQDESIRDAPTDKKIAFLESKGLSNDDIHTLLGVSRNIEATSNDSAQSVGPELSSSKETLTEPTSSLSAQSLPAQTSTATSNDVPPIITYPEFLFQESKPPLLTFQNFLYTLYGTAGLAATIYGASEFLAKPMLASLNSARHELAETAQGNLKLLNEKLENNVSTIPPAVLKSKHTTERRYRDEDDDDEESITSDPTELFHRDIATQTISDLDTSSSSQAVPSQDTQPESASQKALADHLTRLQSISFQLNSVLTAEQYSDTAQNNAKDRLSELHTYLDSLTYNTPTYLNSSLYGSYDDSADAKKARASGGEEEAIAGFKSEVRSVKGTLLSARNFPSGSGGYRAGVGAR